MIKTLLILLLMVGTASPAFSADVSAQEEGMLENREVTGTVASVMRNHLSVRQTAKQGTSEIILPVNDKTRFERLVGLSDLRPGDLVQVQYQRRVKKLEKGKEQILKTFATHISLLKRAPEEGALMSREEE